MVTLFEITFIRYNATSLTALGQNNVWPGLASGHATISNII